METVFQNISSSHHNSCRTSHRVIIALVYTTWGACISVFAPLIPLDPSLSEVQGLLPDPINLHFRPKGQHRTALLRLPYQSDGRGSKPVTDLLNINYRRSLKVADRGAEANDYRFAKPCSTCDSKNRGRIVLLWLLSDCWPSCFSNRFPPGTRVGPSILKR